MKKLPVFILASVLLFSCAGAGVGGEALPPEQQEIAVRAVLGSSGYAATAVNQAVAETGESVRAVLLNEKNLNLDGNGSTADCKISATCGASVTYRIIIKAFLVDAVSEVTLSLDGLPVNCTAVLNGNLELKEKISATTQNVGVSLQIANGNKDGIGLKVTRTDTGEVIFDQPVFILFDTSYDITGGSSASVQADVSCKINGERYESEWLTSWSSDDYLILM